MFRIGIIGCGKIAQVRHLPEYAANPDVQIAALTDLNEERTRELHENRDNFIKEVDKTLHRHYKAIKTLTERGTYFFDYGNSFMKAMYDAGVKEISKNGYDDKDGFIWPSYVEDIMGPILFDYGSIPLGLPVRQAGGSGCDR